MTLYGKHLATKQIPYYQVHIHKIYKRVIARSNDLKRLDGTMAGIQYS